MTQAMLQGIRVVDLSSVVFGPMGTQALADLGAEVIKIEAPGGDMFRKVGRPAKTPGMGPCHMNLNRGKRSIELDLKLPGSADKLRKLVETADIFIHNIREKGIDHLGFDYEAVRAIRSDIIYIHCVGFGSDGPYAPLPAYDDVIQAATGTTSLLSRVDGDPTPRYLPSLLADKVAGMAATQAALAAIIHRLRTGAGQYVEVPMFEVFTHFMLTEHLFEATFQPSTGPMGYPRQLDPARQPFPTIDGYVSIVPYTEASWLVLLRVLGCEALLDDSRFATPSDRARNITELYRVIGERTAQQSTAYWIKTLTDVEIPVMAARDLADLQQDPHLLAVEFFQPRIHPTEGAFLELKAPIHYSAWPYRPAAFAPTLGQDNALLDAL